MNKSPETKESLEQKQRTLDRLYMSLIRESRRKPKPGDVEARLSRLRDEIYAVYKELKGFK
jgi:hypothetical protein